MSEENKKKIPVKISTDEILDPQARWICQRLDKLYSILMDLLIEVRAMNGTLKTVEANILGMPKVDKSYEDGLGIHE